MNPPAAPPAHTSGGGWRAAWLGSALYDALLRGRSARIVRGLTDVWAGDPDAANAMFQGRYAAAGSEIAAPNRAPWSLAVDNPGWHAYFHGFEWLRDFRAVGGASAQRHARDLTLSWIRAHDRWSPLPWRPEVIARRIAAWTLHADFLGGGGEDGFAAALLASLGKQIRHLGRQVGDPPSGAAGIATLTGFAIAALAVERGEARLRNALRRLDEELARQILPDGGHGERNPERHHQVLRDCLSLRAALFDAGRDVPRPLADAIDRLAPMLRFFRHGDGGLALFNGGHEDARDRLDATLAVADAKGRAPQSAPQSGFERLLAQRTLAIIDIGLAPPAGLDRDAHAGALAFELSVGGERMIVNCGAPFSNDRTWRQALRATAAHSTLTIADTNSIELVEHGVGRHARTVTVRRLDDGERSGVEATHDGYHPLFGLVHHRRMAVEPGGNRILGEDWLSASEPARARGERSAMLRFHLHPDVRASLRQDQRAVILRLPKGSGWVFSAPEGVIALEDSIYFGIQPARRTQQIVVSGPARDGLSLPWAIERVGE